jgi:hypothetical protein
MKKPTLEEVDAYCQAHHPEVDAIAFWNFYEAKNWMLGKNKIINWHCCVATWSRREKEKISGYKPIACRKCMDAGTLVTGEVCTCLKGGEAKQARIVMAKIKATIQQMKFPSIAPTNTRRELERQAQKLMEPAKKPEYAPTEDFQKRREMLKNQAAQIAGKR